ncbi:MAG: ACR3 family arsenite efflux transporter [Candidatus Lokiarchaeota archaeon]|nr:ACR3 family arsenite efflux transporter [Candidatus Lokiarchaeota archaeon]
MTKDNHDSSPNVVTNTKGILGRFEKYLAIWVVLCMSLGLLLSKFIPSIGETINSWHIGGISIPIAICLFLMMYPALLNLQLEKIKKLRTNPKPILLTLLSNWIIAPLVAYALGKLFLQSNDQLFVSLILLGSSPCTAMVLVWGKLAQGNQEQNVINTSINTLTLILFYAPLIAFLTGLEDIPIDRILLLISVVIFIGVPLILGIITKKLIIRYKTKDWFDNVYRPFVGKIAVIALLMTLIILFSLNGDVLINNFDLLVLVSAPLLIGFALVVGYNIMITRKAKLAYPEAITSVIIGSSSHFEIAIATAVSIYGVGSIAALGTTMGLFWEVPIMLSLVYLGKYLHKKGFWQQQ